jgi:transcriptional regulator with XRE-family HTH domain
MRRTRKTPKQPLDHEPEAVEYARKAAGLTKTQLAERCGVSLSLISEIESGNRNATPEMLIRLADALNCPKVILERKRAQTTPATPGDLRELSGGERAEPGDMPAMRGAAVAGDGL